ncbi:hypothetical protein GQ607_017376 [Colletotrichum asianum]|uniref:Uncharacterized protein n=1 Tax=Colletotrichum asianum TaxID=702518 RepID=A0A8H3VWE8_9PEZI|nr:hypothetical protein GQ607_017376 [Colletotrichum asianum]
MLLAYLCKCIRAHLTTTHFRKQRSVLRRSRSRLMRHQSMSNAYTKRVPSASCPPTSKSRLPSHIMSRSNSLLCSSATQSNVRRMPAHTPPSRAPSFFKVATDVDVTASLATPGSLPTIPGPFPRRPSGGQCALPPLLDRPPLTHHHMASLFDTRRYSGSDVSSVLSCHKALIELALADLAGDTHSPSPPPLGHFIRDQPDFNLKLSPRPDSVNTVFPHTATWI